MSDQGSVAPSWPPRSRLAPTPSGYLHLGNAFNFVFTWLLMRSQNGLIRLRIDDLDRARLREAYLADIFHSLDWLGLDWDEGPISPEDHLRHHSQQLRLARYQAALDQLAEQNAVFACRCSRRQVQARSQDGQYPGTCRARNLPLDAPQHAWRLRTPQPCPVMWHDGWLGQQQLDLYQAMRDPVLRKKDGLAAYQVASVIDDLDHGVTHVVRGADLLPSSATQRYLAERGGWTDFLSIGLLHHPLLIDSQGQKLAKSAGAPSLMHLRKGLPSSAPFYRWLSEQMNWPEPATNATDALALFRHSATYPPYLAAPQF
jgi:glutamyl/glutaminyl-tRNA synthetase